MTGGLGRRGDGLAVRVGADAFGCLGVDEGAFADDGVGEAAARCLIELGTPAAAEPLLTRALAGYNHDHAREVALYQTWLAEGHARAGDAARAVVARIDTTAIDAG